MSRRLQAQRGTIDVLPDEWTRRRVIEDVCREELEAAGYRRIETPVFEATELFARGVGESTDVVQKEMYTFADHGGRSITLRPEGTAAVCRAYLEHGMHTLTAPVKLWYLGPFFRYERAQAGRQRQFWQVGAEAIGSDDPALDAESIVLLHRVYARLGVRGLRLRLGSLGTAASRAVYRERLVAHLRARADELSDEVRERIDLNPLRAFDSDHPGTAAVMADAPLLHDELDAADAEHLAEVRALLDAAGVPYELDPTLVRGLDYYARTVFEFTSGALGAQSGVGGGGRYDGLIELLGGPATPAVGWASGIERLLLAADAADPPDEATDLSVAWVQGARGPAFALVEAARAAGLRARMDLAPGRGMKGQMRRAGRAGARFVAVAAPDGGLELKDMDGGGQEPVADAAELVARVASTTAPAAPRHTSPDHDPEPR